MVRIKHRYLLVKILYPSAIAAKQAPSEKATIKAKKKDEKPKDSLLLPLPAALQAHAPTPDTFTVQHLLRMLRHQLADLFGEYGSGIAAAGLSVKYWSNATSTFIVRCARSCERMVWAAITYATCLKLSGEGGPGGARGVSGRTSAKEREKEVEVVLKVMRVSGTIRKCQEEAIRQARALCGRAKGLQLALEQGLLQETPSDGEDEADPEGLGMAAKGKEQEDSGDSDLPMDDEQEEDEDED